MSGGRDKSLPNGQPTSKATPAGEHDSTLRVSCPECHELVHTKQADVCSECIANHADATSHYWMQMIRNRLE